MVEKRNPSNRNIDDLPIKIAIELDSKEVNIKDLTEMSTGALVSFSDKPADRVRLFANNKHFANATLVMLDNQIAVRIDQIV